MGRMEKYEEENNTSYSRTTKNEDLYKDVYLNNTLIDFDKIIDEDVEELEEEKNSVIEYEKIDYVEKNYDINKYLEEKRMMRTNDNLPRILDEEIKKSDSEIDEIVNKLEQKEKEEDLFTSLMPDQFNTTIIEGKQKLDNVVSDTAIDNYVMNKEMDETNSFMDLDETKVLAEKKEKKTKEKKEKKVSKKKNASKSAGLTIMFLCILALILIGAAVYVAIKVF